MGHVDGSLAKSLDFDVVARVGRRAVGRSSLSHRPRRPIELLRGPGKYKVLEKRRRAAQIHARHTLDLLEMIERGDGGNSAVMNADEHESSR